MLLLAFLCLFMSVLSPYHVRGQDAEFLIGLIVEYDVADSRFTGTQRFEVLGWATGPGQKLATIKMTETSDGSTTTVTDVIDLATWDISLIIPPILVDVSDWQPEQTVTIPSCYYTYGLSASSTTVPEGTYFCWFADYYESSGDLWTSRGETMFYERALGVLVSWRYHYWSMPSNNQESSAALRYNNMAQFGRPTAESLLLLGFLVAVTLGVGVCALILAVRHLRRRGAPSQGRLLSGQRTAPQSVLEMDQPLTSEQATHKEVPPIPPPGDDGQRCVICRYDMRPGEDVLTCPHCGARAHRSHFLEWAKIKRSCPKCHETLEQTDFQ
jgi:hypothetical protein